MVPSISRLVCGFPACNQVFKNKSGLTKHTRTKHPISPQAHQRLASQTVLGPGCIPPRAQSLTTASENWSIDGDFNVENEVHDRENRDTVAPEEGTWVDMGYLFRVFHPHLTGMYQVLLNCLSAFKLTRAK